MQMQDEEEVIGILSPNWSSLRFLWKASEPLIQSRIESVNDTKHGILGGAR